MRSIFGTVLLLLLAFRANESANALTPVISEPDRGAASSQPTRSWESGFLTGNGRMGAIFFGNPGEETVVMSHCRLFLPLGSAEAVPDIGRFLPELRTLIKEHGYSGAMAFMENKGKAAGWSGLLQNTDPFHPAFFLNITAPVDHPGGYLRTEDFATGEVAVKWSADGKECQRRLFVSRPDNVAVLSLTGEHFSCDIAVPPIDPAARVRAYQLNHPAEPQENSAANLLIQQELTTDKDEIGLFSRYKFGKGGYAAAIRIVVKGGSATSDGQKVSIKDADEVILLMRVQPFKEGEASPLPALQADLAALPADYQKLFASHAKAHGELFHRVSTDFGGAAERKLTTDELFRRAREQNVIPPALLEKIYDGSRYMILCASGDRPPNLQGIWTGTWQPAWSGDYTLDTNLQLAIAHLLSAGTPELLQGYFGLIDETIADWRINAKNFYGARGIMAPARESNIGLQTHWSSRFHGSFWTCGAGWLAHWYFDYYRYTGDRDFLRHKAIPFMKEVALFYQDFLFPDDSGKLRFSPSYSAENGDGDNATQDIMVAHELLTNLIAACKELGVEADNVPGWQATLDQLPPYLVLPNGELQEWSTPGVPNKNNHRHMSHLYALWQSGEFDPETTPAMWKASEVAYEARMNSWFRNPENAADQNRGVETASHGRMHLGLSAARLGRGEDVWEILTKMSAGGSIYPSMATAHYANGKTFNMDANGAIPEIINNALVFSMPGRLDFLPALPQEMPRGEIGGLLGRGQVKINHLKWEPGAIEAEIVSSKQQTVQIRVPKAVKVTACEGFSQPPADELTAGNIGSVLLRPNVPLTVKVQFE